MSRYKEYNIDSHYGYLCPYNYATDMTRTCKCGKRVSIYFRERRQICWNCGRIVFLTKKDEYDFYMKRKFGK